MASAPKTSTKCRSTKYFVLFCLKKLRHGEDCPAISPGPDTAGEVALVIIVAVVNPGVLSEIVSQAQQLIASISQVFNLA